MVIKRPFCEDDGGSEVPNQQSKRFATVVRHVLGGLSQHEFLARLEPFIRRMVREQTEHTIRHFLHSLPGPLLNQIESSGATVWQLQFENKLPTSFFTGSRVESEDGKPLKIVIIDNNSKKIIKSGPLSSLRIGIVVLDGDFGVDDQENWNEKEFNDNVVREREGKRPLLTGDKEIALRDGVGYIGNISVTDNSSWIRSRKFRLGARVLRLSTEARVREAITEAFVVKDHRGESYKKHHPPYPNDEVWRLEKIAKDGTLHKRLADKGVSTVKEFLQLYFIDQSSLQNILGGGSLISCKTWKKIIDHATACVWEDKLYVYYSGVQEAGLLLNSFYRVIGARFDGQAYPLDKLNTIQMRVVEDLKVHAYRNLNLLVPVNEPSLVGPSVPLSSLQADLFSCPSLGVQHLNFLAEQQDQQEVHLGSNNTIRSLPYCLDGKDNGELEVPMAHSFHPMQGFAPMLSSSFRVNDSLPESYSGTTNWPGCGTLESVVQIGHLTADENSQSETSTWQRNGLFFPTGNEAVGIVSSDFGIHISRNGKPKARWCMVRAAIKWWISVRRDVAAKKWESFFV